MYDEEDDEVVMDDAATEEVASVSSFQRFMDTRKVSRFASKYAATALNPTKV